VWSALSGGDTRAALAIAGAAVYVVGSIGLTFAINVPMNDRLETLDAHDAGAASHWRTYVRRWTAWNHVRSAAPLIAATLFIVALTEPA
jgi:uncharacterized membrane protein